MLNKKKIVKCYKYDFTNFYQITFLFFELSNSSFNSYLITTTITKVRLNILFSCYILLVLYFKQRNGKIFRSVSLV